MVGIKYDVDDNNDDDDDDDVANDDKYCMIERHILKIID
jgi:hypothetical protein